MITISGWKLPLALASLSLALFVTGCANETTTPTAPPADTPAEVPAGSMEGEIVPAPAPEGQTEPEGGPELSSPATESTEN